MGSISRFGALPIAGLCITIMAILTQWNQNQLRLGFESVWPTLLVASALVTCVTVAAWSTFGSWPRAGLFSGLAAFYVFYVPPIIRLIQPSYQLALLIHIGMILILSLVWIRALRAKDILLTVSRINIISTALLLFTAAPIILNQLDLELRRKAALDALPPLEGHASAESPDVWHILFDRYASPDTLKTIYQFDDAGFIDALMRRGFTVVEPAFSNYQRTSHSVASTMNGSLLDPLASRMTDRQDDWVPVYRAMRDGAVVRTFNDMSYKTVFAGSWWEPTRFSSTATTSIQVRALPQLARLILDQSSIGFWVGGREIPWLDGRGDQCFRANEKFRRLRALTKDPARKHVFAHFLVPHPPFVLNADGSCRSLERARSTNRRDNYISAVEFANREALNLVDAILAGPRPAVIVIHSDEGPWPEPYVGNEMGLGTDPVQIPWENLTPGQLREKTGILLAMRAPSGSRPRTVPQSPVQIYPAILRDYFGSKQKLPPNRHSIFLGDKKLYQFRDIEDRLTTP